MHCTENPSTPQINNQLPRSFVLIYLGRSLEALGMCTPTPIFSSPIVPLSYNPSSSPPPVPFTSLHST